MQRSENSPPERRRVAPMHMRIPEVPRVAHLHSLRLHICVSTQARAGRNHIGGLPSNAESADEDDGYRVEL